MENVNGKWIFDYDNGCDIWIANSYFNTKGEAREAGTACLKKEGYITFRIGQCFSVGPVGIDMDFTIDNEEIIDC